MYVQPDHTKPTIAFLVVCVLAAATVGTGLARQDEVVSAVDEPGAGVIAVPDKPAPVEPAEPSDVWDFDLARVVTLDADPRAQGGPRQVRTPSGRRTQSPTLSSAPRTGGSTAGGSGPTSGGGTSGGTSGDTSGGGTPGSGSSTSGGSGDVAQAPGRSDQGQGLAKGQDGSPPGSGTSPDKGSTQRTATSTGPGHGRR